jgi:hypothetical protein
MGPCLDFRKEESLLDAQLQKMRICTHNACVDNYLPLKECQILRDEKGDERKAGERVHGREP